MEFPVVDVGTTSARQVWPRPAETLLHVQDLTVRFPVQGREFIAVDRVSFDIGAGEIVGLLGESGCGKTSIGLSLLGLLPVAARVTCSSLNFSGRNLSSLNESALREVRGAELSIVYQDSSVLNPVMRVGTQVSEVLRAHRKCTSHQARDEAEVMFAAIGLRNFSRIYQAYPHQLSGGQRQRIAIAQALICKPRLVIADEPTASVDPDTADQILDFVQRLTDSGNTSFLFISHDPAALTAVSHRLMVMYAGQIIETGPTGDVCERPLHPYTEALLQCAPHRSALKQATDGKIRLPFIPGRSPDPLEVLPGCSFSGRCGDRMEICSSRRPDQIETLPHRFTCCFKYGME